MLGETMKKLLLFVLLLVFSVNTSVAQDNPQKVKKNIFKEFYNDFLKYGTFYAQVILEIYENSRKDYFVERPPDGDLYSIPRVIEVTEYYPFDYRYGFGIRKLGRFNYERKPGNFWTVINLEKANKNFITPTSAVDGFEYLFHFEKERLRGEEWNNFRYFIRHTVNIT